jgi:DNA-binding YbaB/EbfC family protein
MDMSKIMEQAQQLQQRMGAVQEELAKQKITTTVGGGMVTAVVNGKNELLELKIEKEVIDPDDPIMLQDLIVAAVNDAMQKSKEAAQGEMSKLTGGLNLNVPGLSGMFGG